MTEFKACFPGACRFAKPVALAFQLNELAIGTFEEASIPSPEISALLNVAIEKDLGNTDVLYH